MPMYSGFDDRFDAAMANKLRNQDVHGQAETANAAANTMHAQTELGLAPSMGLRNVGTTQAALMDAGTNRLNTASENPMGFSSTQVNSLGLGSLGITPTGQANQFGSTVYGTGTGPSRAGEAYLQGLAKYKPIPERARGGVIGDVDNDTGRDTQEVRARPGEYFLNPETITHGFGNGNYDHGVRNLNRIVLNATGQQPGATYSKKGKAGFERSGDVRARAKRMIAPQDMSDEEWNKYVGSVRQGKSVYPQPAQDMTDAQWNAQVPRGNPARDMTNAQWNAHVNTVRRGGPVNPRAALQVPTASAVTESPRVPSMRPMTDAEAATMSPVPTRPSFRAMTEAEAATMSPVPEHGISPQLAQVDAINNPNRAPKVSAPNASQPAPPGTPRQPPPPSTWGMNDRGAGFVPDPFGRAPTPPTLQETGNKFQIRNQIQAGGKPGDSVSFNYGAGHGMGPEATPIVVTADKTGRFNQFGNLPEAPVSAGPTVDARTQSAPPAGVRAKPTAPAPAPAPAPVAEGLPWEGPRLPRREEAAPTPIGGQMWKEPPPPYQGVPLSSLPRYPGMARGGVVPEKGLRDVPGFQASGWVPGDGAGWAPGAPPIPDPLDREYGPASRPRPPPVQGVPWTDAEFLGGTPPEMTARERWRATAGQPIDVQAGMRKAYEAVKEFVPSAKTLAPAARFVSKGAVPVAAAMDLYDVGKVYADPKTHGIDTATDVASEVASKAGKWGTAGVGAGMGAFLGGFGGPVAPVTVPLGGLAGGVLGYLGGEKAIQAGREYFGMDPRDPSRKLADAAAAAKAALPAPAAPAVAAPVQEKAPEQAAAQEPPTSMRDLMALRAMALGGGGRAAQAEQRSLLGYLGQVDSQTAAAKITLAHQMAQMNAEHEKQMAAEMKDAFTTDELKDGKPTGQKVHDPVQMQQFLADLSSRDPALGLNPFRMTRDQFQRARKDWAAQEGAFAGARKEFGAGPPGRFVVSQRGSPPLHVAPGNIGIDEWLDPLNRTDFGDLASSWWNQAKGPYGNPMATRYLYQDVPNPLTGQMQRQALPASKALPAPGGNAINADALNFLVAQENARRGVGK